LPLLQVTTKFAIPVHIHSYAAHTELIVSFNSVDCNDLLVLPLPPVALMGDISCWSATVVDVSSATNGCCWKTWSETVPGTLTGEMWWSSSSVSSTLCPDPLSEVHRKNVDQKFSMQAARKDIDFPHTHTTRHTCLLQHLHAVVPQSIKPG